MFEKNTVGKGEIAHYKQFLLFSVFSKDLYCRQNALKRSTKPMLCIGKECN